ncbi:hypothetical protein D3C71_1683960 [compost metagenome]
MQCIVWSSSIRIKGPMVGLQSIQRFQRTSYSDESSCSPNLDCGTGGGKFSSSRGNYAGSDKKSAGFALCLRCKCGRCAIYCHRATRIRFLVNDERHGLACFRRCGRNIGGCLYAWIARRRFRAGKADLGRRLYGSFRFLYYIRHYSN